MSSGKIAQVVGPVVDVAFAAGDKLPEINNALVVYTDEQKSKRIVLEVALELGEGVVRTIAMESTDGLTRGLEVLDTGRPISVPVGKDTLGRVFNVLGDTLDDGTKLDGEEHQLSMNCQHLLKSLKQGLKLSTCLPLTLKVVKSDSLVVPVLVKPFLFKS